MDLASRPYAMYLLVDPRTKKIRYVGKTKQKLSRRLRRHIQDAREKSRDGSWVDRTYRANWIRSVLSDGYEPVIEEMCRYHTLEEVNKAEIFFIYHIRAVADDLTNTTDGGDGGIVTRAPSVTDDVVISSYLSGDSAGEIAKKFKTCKKRVLGVVKDAGIPLHRAGRPRSA